eukprot:2056196-Rhodomonas_salina.2
MVNFSDEAVMNGDEGDHGGAMHRRGHASSTNHAITPSRTNAVRSPVLTRPIGRAVREGNADTAGGEADSFGRWQHTKKRNPMRLSWLCCMWCALWKVSGEICLGLRCAARGAEIASDRTRPPAPPLLLQSAGGSCLRRCYAMPCTEIASAMQCP